MTIKDLFKTKRPVVSCEVFPPKKDGDVESIYEAIRQISALKPDFISVTYGAGGSGNTNRTTEISSFIQKENNVKALAHLTCVGADKAQIQQVLGEMQSKGIRNILALRGDLPKGSKLESTYQYAEDLIREIRENWDFVVGAACYPEGHIDCDDSKLDLERLYQKQEAGADFLVTQLFFDNDIFFRFLDNAGKAGITLPISAGVMPILGRAQIERMIFMCGVSLPSAIIRLLHKYENNPEDLRKAGIEHAAVQLEELLRGGADGVHIYTMNKPDIAQYCLSRIGQAK